LLTQPGDWRLEARARIRGEDDVTARFSVPRVGAELLELNRPKTLFDLPFTFVDWNIVAGGAMVVLGVGTFLIWRKRPPAWQPGTASSVFAASGFAIIAGIVLLFGVHAQAEDTDSPANPIPPTTASILAGQAIFQNNCQVCHGATGEGDGPGAGSLNVPRYVEHIPYHGDGNLFIWISEGMPLDSDVKTMPPWKDKLSEEDRWNVINFLRATFGSGQFEPVLPSDLAGTPAPGG
jgi:mono/diheme cytochrome c family protein